jgi:hypothetical protein
LACLLIPMVGCSQLFSKPENQIDYAKYSQQVEPLSAELGQKEEYEFALDLAKLQIERQHYERAEVLLQKTRRLPK